MSAIETCRTEALGGHVAACTKCNHPTARQHMLCMCESGHIACNSCKIPLTGRRFGKAKSAERRALPQMPGTLGTGLDGGARRGPVARRVLPCGLHATRRGRADRPLEQARDLQPVVLGIGRDGGDHCRRSRAPWCARRYDQRAAYIAPEVRLIVSEARLWRDGISAHPSSITRQSLLAAMRGPTST